MPAAAQQTEQAFALFRGVIAGPGTADRQRAVLQIRSIEQSTRYSASRRRWIGFARRERAIAEDHERLAPADALDWPTAT